MFSRDSDGKQTIETHCMKEFEINELSNGLNKIYHKMDDIIVGQSEIKTELAVYTERNKNAEKALERIGRKIDSLEKDRDDLVKRTRDLEEHVRNNSSARAKGQAWLERIGFAALAAYLGWDKLGD